DEPAPEAGLSQSIIEDEPKRFREPIIVPREHAEKDTADNDVVKMGHEEHAIVQHEVDWRNCQQHAGQAANDERDHKTEQTSMGVAKTTRPPNIVKSQLNTLTPVGTAMIADMMPKKALTLAPAPMVKK